MLEEEAKRQAAREAARLLPQRGIIGLGTGSTARYFIEAVGEAVRAGMDLTGVPTSNASRAQATALGIPLLPDSGPWHIDLCVDGADEVSADLDLIKGGGGAHTREKIVNFVSERRVTVVDESKLSTRLGERWPVPIEILEFACHTTVCALERFGEPALRTRDGFLCRTDAGNLICDLRVGPMADPASVDLALRGIPGVVETGLFCGAVDLLIVAGGSGVRTIVKGG